jgi:DNA-directed RNA polymerase specialized sigma24 family protein
LLVISLNKLRKLGTYHRAIKRDARRTEGGEKVCGLSNGGSDEAVLDLRMTIDELLEQFDPVAARIVRYRMEGREVAEIATMTERSKRTVERVLQTFRHRLTQEIQEIPGLDVTDSTE